MNTSTRAQPRNYAVNEAKLWETHHGWLKTGMILSCSVDPGRGPATKSEGNGWEKQLAVIPYSA